MFFKVGLYIQSNNKYYMLGKIEQNEDGSLYVFLPTNKKVGYLKKTSIHTSGRINFDLGFKKVQFIEPLIKITNINYICSIYIPSLGVLKEIDDQGIINNHKKNIVINFINNLNNYFTIDFFITPKEITNINDIISIKFLDTFYLNTQLHFSKIDERSKDRIILYTAHDSMYEKQLVDRFEAEKEYRNILYKTENAILVGPNQKGEILLHFSNVMHHTPLLLIEFDDENLYIDRLMGNKTKLKFVIKDKKHGNQIVMNNEKIRIKKLILDAYFYENDYIPEGYLKPKEL